MRRADAEPLHALHAVDRMDFGGGLHSVVSAFAVIDYVASQPVCEPVTALISAILHVLAR